MSATENADGTGIVIGFAVTSDVPLSELAGSSLTGVPGHPAPNAHTLAAIFPTSPYDAFPLDEHPADEQGWNSRHRAFADLIAALRPSRIIEVGVWKGAASIHMAGLTRELGLDCEIVCVDTWLGSPEHILRKDLPTLYESLRVRNGYPRLFQTFMSNVIREGLDDRIVPLPMTSESAIVVLQRLGLQADLIHIDAAHEYGPVLRDLREYWRLLSERGVLIADDYGFKPGVTRAVHDFALEVRREICSHSYKAMIAKSAGVRVRVDVR